MWHDKLKAVTFSFDDGITQDIRMVELLDKYGLKATFNLNSEKFGVIKEEFFGGKKFIKKRIEISEVKDLYENHEVAAHTLTHPNLTEIEQENEIIRQVEQDRLNLEICSFKDVVGMAYPCGGINNDDRVADIIRRNTGIRYARTITSTHNFKMQDNLLRFNPTAHFGDNKIFELADEFLNLKPNEPQLFYIWGHSYECDYVDSWDRLEELFKRLSGHEDVYYATNKDVFGL